MQLSFEFYPDTQGPEGEFDWVVQCQVGAFEGLQTFIVGQTDFSHRMPILYFAHTLRVVVRKFAQGIQEHEHFDFDSTYLMYFKRKNGFVEVSDSLIPARIGIVPVSVFVSTAEVYAKDVYQSCCKMCPGLDEQVGKWWHFLDE